MTRYNTLQLKLSPLQFNKLKWGMKNGTQVTLKRSSNIVGDSNKSYSRWDKFFQICCYKIVT